MTVRSSVENMWPASRGTRSCSYPCYLVAGYSLRTSRWTSWMLARACRCPAPAYRCARRGRAGRTTKNRANGRLGWDGLTD
mmetsp:Transcript_1080/g.689  ORF Transcript_1080/g.689 Transcript_1080/m.689 type:complete len:81 (+) Transcript_1080:255-497(+)